MTTDQEWITKCEQSITKEVALTDELEINAFIFEIKVSRKRDEN